MASNVDFFVAFLLGILPGLAILWVSLRRFDRPQVDHTLFDDRRVFGSLAVGLIFGTVASIFALALPRGDLASFAVAVGVSFVFEESFKLAWLNRRSYRGRFDTTFYGVPLGIGAAASGVVAAAWASREILYVPETFALLIVYSISLGLVNAYRSADRIRRLARRHVESVPAGDWRPPCARGVPLSVPAPGGRTVRRDLRGHVRRFCLVDLLLRLPGDSAGHA